MTANKVDLEIADTVRSPMLRAEVIAPQLAGAISAPAVHSASIRGMSTATKRQTGTRLIAARSEATLDTLSQISMGLPSSQTTPNGTATTSDTALPTFEFTTTLLLSAIAGFVDTAGVIALYGLFVAHVTGGLVSIGLALTERSSGDVLARLSMVLVFIVAVAGTALFSRSKRRRGQKPLTALLGLMTAALALFAIVGMLLQDSLKNSHSRGLFVVGATAVMAMAIQNTLMRNALGGASPTTIMTGNLTQVTIDLIELACPESATSSRHRRRSRVELKRRLIKSGAPLAGFLVGGSAGAVATHAIGFAGILIPTFAVGFLAFASYRRETRSTAGRPDAER